MKYLIIILFVVFILKNTFAQMHPIPASSLELKLDFGSLRATLDEKGKMNSLTLVEGAKVYNTPISELKDLDSPNLQSLRIFTSQTKNFTSLSKLNDGACIVVMIQFGEDQEIVFKEEKNEKNEVEIVRVYSRVYFIFGSEGFHHRSKRVASGRNPLWTLYYKDVGEAEIEDGTGKMDLRESSLARPPSLAVP